MAVKPIRSLSFEFLDSTAKKPHGDIATADNYFQTIRYGWSVPRTSIQLAALPT
jgi:hypothetical protein